MGARGGDLQKITFPSVGAPPARDLEILKVAWEKYDLTAEKGPVRLRELVTMVLGAVSVIFTRPHPRARFDSFVIWIEERR